MKAKISGRGLMRVGEGSIATSQEREPKRGTIRGGQDF